MKVLLTRATDEGARSAAKLAAAGHVTLASPVLEMVPTGATWPSGVIDAVLATSARGFELFSDTPDWPLPEARRLLPLFVVGERTRDAAVERGFTGPTLIAPDAELLAAAIEEARQRPSRLVYLAGRDRKPDLERALAKAGHDVLIVEAYAAQAADALGEAAIAALEAGEIGAVLHYSRRSAEIFLDLTRRAGLDLRNQTHIAISQDAATPLWEAHCTEVHVAEKPNEQAMITAVDTLSGLTWTLFARGAPKP